MASYGAIVCPTASFNVKKTPFFINQGIEIMSSLDSLRGFMLIQSAIDMSLAFFRLPHRRVKYVADWMQ